MSSFTPANRRSLLVVTAGLWLVLGTLLVLAARKPTPPVVSAPAGAAAQVALVSKTSNRSAPAASTREQVTPAQLTETKQPPAGRERLTPPQLVEPLQQLSTPRERLAPPQLAEAKQTAAAVSPVPSTKVAELPQGEVLPAPRVEAVLPQAEELPAPRVEDASK